jgi:hypothetical protein
VKEHRFKELHRRGILRTDEHLLKGYGGQPGEVISSILKANESRRSGCHRVPPSPIPLGTHLALKRFVNDQSRSRPNGLVDLPHSDRAGVLDDIRWFFSGGVLY